MKFKREDLGLYFAFGLVGGGVGLLIGAFITSRLSESSEVPSKDENNGFARLDPKYKIKEPDEKKSQKKKFKKQGKKNQLTKKEEARLRELGELYEITPIQIELVRSGVMSVDDLEGAIMMDTYDEKREPYNYNAIYVDTKPDLDDLVADEILDDLPERKVEDLLVVIDGNFEILLEPPEEKDSKNKRVIWYDIDDDSLYTLNRKGEPIPRTIDGIVTPEVWEIIRPFLMFEPEICPIYVDKLGKAHFFEFNTVGGSTEEDLKNNADTS